jgi:hypothetical protein
MSARGAGAIKAGRKTPPKAARIRPPVRRCHAPVWAARLCVVTQASVFPENEIRCVFRIVETTRHAERNRLAFQASVLRTPEVEMSGISAP